MKTFIAQNGVRAFTLFETLIVIAVLMILAVLLLKSHTRGKRMAAQRIACIGNLKQDGLAFRIWEGDHNDKFPMEVSVTNGGTMEFAGGPQTFRHFEVMSNELNTPKILFCPAESDTFRKQANTFEPASVVARGGVAPIQFSSNSNLSYFVGVDATVANPSMFLAGDHNLNSGAVARGGVLELLTNRPVEWTGEMHIRKGNVALADGSVQSYSSVGLQLGLVGTGVATNRLSMP